MIESAVQCARNAKRYTRKAVDCRSPSAGKSGSANVQTTRTTVIRPSRRSSPVGARSKVVVNR
jgi:hypothetical protein